jgi:galactokinase
MNGLASSERAQLLARSLAGFSAHFGGEPQLLVRAPGRVNLIGEHTDYSDGFCLPCAIDRETLVVLRPRADAQVNVLACDEGGALDSFGIAQPITRHESAGWANYVRGTLAALQAQGVALAGADVAIAGNVPLGAGLSSSAALEMAVATAFDAMAGAGLDVRRRARAGQWAEHHFAGCQCGILDQLASAAGVAGHALLLDCRTQETQPIPLPPDVSVLVIHSRVQRGLVDSEYNLRRQQCQQAAEQLGVPMLRDVDPALWQSKGPQLPPELFRRARHVVTENQRTLDAAQALRQGELRRAGELMRASHASMRDDFDIVPPAVDQLAMLVNEVLDGQGGARPTGGGFGGCVVALLPTHRVQAVQDAVARGYRSPGGDAALVWACSASDGAKVLA